MSRQRAPGCACRRARWHRAAPGRPTAIAGKEAFDVASRASAPRGSPAQGQRITSRSARGSTTSNSMPVPSDRLALSKFSSTFVAGNGKVRRTAFAGSISPCTSAPFATYAFSALFESRELLSTSANVTAAAATAAVTVSRTSRARAAARRRRARNTMSDAIARRRIAHRAARDARPAIPAARRSGKSSTIRRGWAPIVGSLTSPPPCSTKTYAIAAAIRTGSSHGTRESDERLCLRSIAGPRAATPPRAIAAIATTTAAAETASVE